MPMAVERIFNFYIFFGDGSATEYGADFYEVELSDEEKITFLRSRIDQDHSKSVRFALSRTFTPEEWRSAARLGTELAYFEEAFLQFGNPWDPFFCITPIVDGKQSIDLVVGPEPFRGDIVTKQPGRGTIPDYLVHYVSENTFRIVDLIHDDYFIAIRLLFNAKLYVSCSKLIMSCIDTLSYVEFGDRTGNFCDWVDGYTDLSTLGISANELWEFRNSVLHMTNLSSRKVVSGKVSSIMPYVGGQKLSVNINSGAPKPFNLFELIEALANGIGRWGESYNTDPNKTLKFIERYDTTISDGRLAQFQVNSQK